MSDDKLKCYLPVDSPPQAVRLETNDKRKPEADCERCGRPFKGVLK